MAIIDGDARFARQVRQVFEAEGFEVVWFDRPSKALPELRSRTFDLILATSDGGPDLYRRLRNEARSVDVPIIAATVDPDSHAEALAAGADGSILKSFGMRELLARTTAVLRRASRSLSDTAIYSAPSIEIFPDTMRIIRSGRQIALSKGEADVLALLIRNAPASVPVERIRAELSTPAAPLSRSGIEGRLKNLRRKIGADLIVNRIGFGYSFAPPPDGSGSAMKR